MKRGQSGFSLVELVIGLAVLALVASIGAGTIANLQNQVTTIQTRLKARTNVSTLVESIVENVSQYIRVFEKLSPIKKGQLLGYQGANIAFNDSGIFAKSQCAKCTGRIAYLIEPHQSLPGFNVVTIVVYTAPEESVQYRFITGEL